MTPSATRWRVSHPGRCARAATSPNPEMAPRNFPELAINAAKFQLNHPQPQHGTAVRGWQPRGRIPEHQRRSSMATLLLLIPARTLNREDRRKMFAWIFIGLISGWLAGKILNGNGYGMMADIGLGLLGGIIGGMIFAVLGVRAHNFVGAILMSTAGATALVVATRIIRDEI